MFMIQNLKFKATTFLVGQADANANGTKIASAITWLIGGGGLLLAVWGIVQVTQSGRQNDSQGKMEGSWLILGGVLLMGLAAGSMITGVFSNPPGM